jgi:hypothetical protein
MNTYKAVIESVILEGQQFITEITPLERLEIGMSYPLAMLHIGRDYNGGSELADHAYNNMVKLEKSEQIDGEWVCFFKVYYVPNHAGIQHS